MGKQSYTHNRALLMERFPKLALLAPTWEETDSATEALAPFDPGKAEGIYVFGLGGGAPYFQLKSWVAEKAERKLIFLEDDPGSFAAFLALPEAGEILADEQVHFELFTPGEVELIAEKFPLKRIEVLSLPSKKGARFSALRLRLLRKTALSHALRIDRLHGYQPFHNFVQNLKHLPGSFYANRLKGAFKNIPAIVCGAGPSLSAAIPLLKELDGKALLIAGGSTLAALSSKGISPHFGVAIDPNLEEYRRFRNSFAFEVPLLYSTRVFPKIFQTCNGPFGYLRCGIGGVPEIWMEEELGLLDPLIGEHLSPEAISVTAIAAAAAQFFGCNPILFAGVDMAYTGKKRYAEGVAVDEEEMFALLDAEKSAADRILKRRDKRGEWVHTAVRWVMESSSLSYFAKKHKEIRFIDATDGGIGIRGVPYMPLQDAAKKYLKRTTDLRTRVQEQIAHASMPPNSAAIIEEKMGELRESVERVIAHLEILSGKKPGSSALAEIELEDEMAMPYLFYDVDALFSSESKWAQFLDLALKYREVAFKPF